MKTMKFFIADEQVGSVIAGDALEFSSAMLCTVSNVKEADGLMSFDTQFGEFLQIPFDADAFKVLKEAEKSGESIRINYSTK